MGHFGMRWDTWIEVDHSYLVQDGTDGDEGDMGRCRTLKS